MSIVLKTPPALEPITLAEAKAHLRVDVDFLDEDGYISGLIQAARATIEALEWRSHITQTWELRLDGFPGGNGSIYLPRPPLQLISSIQRLDANGAAQTVAPADYQVDAQSEPGRVQPAYGKIWPASRASTVNAVIVTYIAGYGSQAGNVPARTKHAIKLLVGQWFENREWIVAGVTAARIPETIEALLLPVHSGRVLNCVA